MPEKKKTSASKSIDRRIVSKAGKPSPTATDAAPSASVTVAAPPNAQQQFGNFEAAMKLFHARGFHDARRLFLLAAEGPERDVSHRAKLHAVMCQRRLEQDSVNLHSAEDYYNYGVALINARNVIEARTSLEKALEIAPGADHIHYALALAQALAGDLDGAYENLKRAIELEPRNRIIARQDADFAPLANQPPFDALLYPEKKNW